ncbi:MAG: hypothetical protein LM558_01140 [Thermosphaera sp.]|nr:hypothetical protein [Thermosphaera sp.]
MGYLIESKSEAFFKSGLAKSAFHERIYENLPLDYYLPSVTSVQRMFTVLRERFYPKFYQAHDAFLMHYKPYDVVYQALKRTNKAAPLWRLVVERALRDPQFLDLNKITANSTELSILAAVKFLQNLLRKVDVERIQQQYKDALQVSPHQKTPAQQSTLQSLIQLMDEIVKDAVKSATEAVEEYKESTESAEEVIASLGGQGGTSFSKEALSVIRFLEKPDEFRKHVKLLKYTRFFFSKFLTITPASLVHEQITSVYGGINGVTRMFTEKQISDILPSELILTQLGDAGRALLALKVVQKQLMVYQRSATVKPIVFVDKSGSMAEKLDHWREDSVENPPKISVATGLTLALQRKLNADVYLFDTEVERVNPAKVVETLLRIEADGGTDIDPVLEEIIRIGKQDYIYIVISDGITEASEDVLRKFRESGLARRTKLILIPPASQDYNWVKELASHGNVYRARDVATFETAARKSLSF